MPQSLHRTWAALAVAALAVLLVAFVVGRDFVRDIDPVCATSLQTRPLYGAGSGALEGVSLERELATTPAAARSFSLHYDEKTDPRVGYGLSPQYSNVRIVWNDLGSDGTVCECGSIPVFLSGEAPSDLRLYREQGGGDRYVVKGRWSTSGYASSGYAPMSEVRVAFAVNHSPARHLQLHRAFTAHHLPALVALFAIGALGVALLRSRRAIGYALGMHAWIEARLTPEGFLQGESGETLGTLEQSRIGRLPPGPVLVAPEALSTTGLYRDMPIVQRRSVAEGTHARWASGTMVRLRDARALAVISTLCTLLALGARLIA